MKRTPIKRKTPMSRAPKSDRAKLKQKTWTILSAYVRLRDSIRTTGGIESCRCVTCGKVKSVFVRGGIEAGHFLPGRHASVVYDDRQIHGQCNFCNKYLNGNTLPYRDFMIKEYGEAFVEDLRARDRENRRWKDWELEDMQDRLLRKIVELLKPFEGRWPDPVKQVMKPLRSDLVRNGLNGAIEPHSAGNKRRS